MLGKLHDSLSALWYTSLLSKDYGARRGDPYSTHYFVAWGHANILCRWWNAKMIKDSNLCLIKSIFFMIKCQFLEKYNFFEKVLANELFLQMVQMMIWTINMHGTIISRLTKKGKRENGMENVFFSLNASFMINVRLSMKYNMIMYSLLYSKFDFFFTI